MKKLYALTALLLGMTGCSEETITYTTPVPGDEPSGIAAELGISSKNTWFAAEDERNASIGFKSLGGEVVVDIQTNTTWKYDAVNAGWLTIEKDDVADQLVLNCEGNKVEEQQQATITITAGDKTATISAAQNAYGTLEIAASKNNFQIPAVGELTAEFEVQSTDEDWIFETKDCPWLLLEQQGDKVTMTLDPNEEIEDRETTFVLIAGEGGGNPVSETIRVTQDRAVYVNVSLKTIPLSPTPTESDKKELGIRSNYDWEYTLSENSDWLSATKTEQGLTITAETNSSGSSRTATITVSAGDGKQNQTEQVVTVSQTGLDLDAFILGIDITSSSLKTYLPFDKAIDATIDCADGSIEEIYATYDPDSRGGDPADGRKGKSTIHCVDAENCFDAEVRLYSNLFDDPDPDAAGKDFLACLNPHSLEIRQGCKVEASLASAQPASRFQFMRQGYFCADSKDSQPDHLVFNRAVSLKDSYKPGK